MCNHRVLFVGTKENFNSLFCRPLEDGFSLLSVCNFRQMLAICEEKLDIDLVIVDSASMDREVPEQVSLLKRHVTAPLVVLVYMATWVYREWQPKNTEGEAPS